MNTKEIANRLVELCREGNWSQAHQELYATNAVSIEPKGAPAERVEGMDAIKAKGEQFNAMVQEFHGIEVSEPEVADNYITCRMSLETTMKGAPGPSKMEEICLYTVDGGKIVEEQFFYSPQFGS